MDYYNNMYQQPMYQQPMYGQNPYKPEVKKNSNLDWIIVQNKGQIEQIQVQPGTKAWIMVQNEPVFALRTANNMGLVETEYYKFEKYMPDEAKTQQENYVTKDELVEEISKLRKELKNESNILINE